MARAAVEELLAERRRLLDLISRLPGLLAEDHAERLVAGVAEGCRELTGARFALYVPTETGTEPILTLIFQIGRPVSAD